MYLTEVLYHEVLQLPSDLSVFEQVTISLGRCTFASLSLTGISWSCYGEVLAFKLLRTDIHWR